MPDHALDWRPSRRLSTRAMWALWLVCLAVTPGALLLQRTGSLQFGAISSVHGESLVTFLWILLAWLWPARTLRHRMLGLTVVISFAVQVLTGAALGGDWGISTRSAAAALVQGGVTLALYRWRIGDDTLAPHRPSDIVDLFAASLIGALVVIPLGPAPGVSLSSTSFQLFWWTILSTSYVFVGSACLMLLVQRRPRAEAIPTRVIDVYVQLLVTGVCLGVVLTFDDLPLTWIVLLPAIWAGLSLGPWTSAAYSLTGILAVTTAQAIPGAGAGYGITQLSQVLLLDSLMTAFVFVVLLLSLMRDQRAHLAGEVVHRRQEAVDQAGLLGTIFESINEALVLMDTQGGVQLHNAAAVSILGREKLSSEPVRWLRRMAQEPTFTYSYNRDGSEDGLRILAVQLAAVQYAGSDSIVATVRDVTSEQRRIEELASFAAVAAHDLKSPLAAVQGWIEVAEDALANDPHMAIEALQRGRQATDRMSREIEDWLTYNVAREGVVQPEAIALQPCLDAIAASYPGLDIVVLTPDTVMVDPTLLRHLLSNLIGNAVKYTSPGERPSVAVRSFSGGERGWVRLYVVDAGIGIPEGEEAAIFEPFRRGSAVVGTYEGSGLGLALCKRIVRRHGGMIRAQRNEGPGSTIMVTLPQA